MNENRAKHYYDDFSSWYENERHHGYHAMVDDLETSIVAPLAAGREVLEVGCGTGLIMSRLDGVASRIRGVDLSRGMLTSAAQRGLEVVQGSADELPFADRSFDLAYSFKVLAHVPNIERALAEMCRVLRPGGVMAAEFYNRHSVRYLAKRLGGPGKISESRTEADVFTRWNSPREVLDLLPDGVRFERWQGVRVLTPFARALTVPLLGRALETVERRAVASPAARLGGFLVAICRKEG